MSRSATAAAWAAAARHDAALAVLPDARVWLTDRLRDACALASGATLIGVVAGAGGAGASTLAAALALTAARTSRAGLVDVDPLGGGLDLAVGAEQLPGLRWPDLASVRGRVDGAALVAALPETGGVSVLSHVRGGPPGFDADAVASVCAALRSQLDVLVADLPRVRDASAAAVAAAARAVLVVVPGEVRAVSAAASVVAGLTDCRDVRVVVCRRRAGDHVEPREIARVLGLPLAGWWRFDPATARATESGDPPRLSGRSSVGPLCSRLLGQFGRTQATTR